MKAASSRAGIRRGALLLEVVVALAILVAAMGLLGAQLTSGVQMTFMSEEQMRAAQLADEMLALVQLEPTLQQRMTEDEDLEFPFSKESEGELGYSLGTYPGYFCRIVHEPVDRENEERLRRVIIQILYQRDAEHQDSSAGAQVMRQVAFFKAPPPRINLIEQAGLSEQQAEELRALVPLAGFDPQAVDFQQLMTLLDQDTLEMLMPMLMPLIQQLAAGGIPPELAGLAGQFGLSGMPATAGGAGGRPQGGAGENLGGADAEALAEMIRQAVEAGGDARPVTAPPPGGGRGRGGEGNRGPRRPPPVEDEYGDYEPYEPEPAEQPIDVGRGSGPNGEYTIEDLMRLRDEYERRQRGGG